MQSMRGALSLDLLQNNMMMGISDMKILVSLMIALLLGGGHATAQDLSTAEAVELISRSLPKRVERFIDGLNEPQTFSELIKTGVVASPYDCTPEFRPTCHDVLTGQQEGDWTPEEWAEWLEQDDQAKIQFSAELSKNAADRGFDILTGAEKSWAARCRQSAAKYYLPLRPGAILQFVPNRGRLFGMTATMRYPDGQAFEIDFYASNGFVVRRAGITIQAGVESTPTVIGLDRDFFATRFYPNDPAAHAVLFPLADYEAYDALRYEGIDLTDQKLPDPGPWLLVDCQKLD